MSEMEGPTRRSFLKVMGAATAAIAIPQGLWGCVSEVAFEGRNFDWENQAEAIENQGLYTTDDPGPWAGKEAVHVPVVSFNEGEGSLTVQVMHVMSEEHFIPLIYVRNQNGHIFGFKALTGTDPEATATFDVPVGTTSVTAFAYCNLHNDWKNGRLEIG